MISTTRGAVWASIALFVPLEASGRVTLVLPPEVVRLRSLLVASMLFHALADFARLAEARIVPRAHRQLFVANLVDSLVGILSAPAVEVGAVLASE